MNKLRIGILIREFKTLQNWELRIIENIKNDLNLELVILIKDGRENNDRCVTNKKNKFQFLRLGEYISEFVFNIQISFEEKRYLSNKDTIDKEEIIRYLHGISTIELKPKCNKNIDIFSSEDAETIKSYNLDIILKHGFNIISGEILKASKHGIWLLYHGDNSNNIGPPCFWEILSKQPVVEVKLLKLTSQHE